MPDKFRYDYAVVRVVPKVDREEFINAGVIVSCPDLSFLEARINLNESRLLALDPTVDLDLVRNHLASIPTICRGGDGAGSIGPLPQRQRFLLFTRGGAPTPLQRSNICLQRWSMPLTDPAVYSQSTVL